MYNVPHKYHQVCRLCLTLVNESDIADLQIYKSEKISNETHKNQYSNNVKHCDINESLSKCECTVFDPKTCCCKCDNSLSTVQNNNETDSFNQFQEINYTPSVPSASASPPCTIETNRFDPVFSNRNRRQTNSTPLHFQSTLPSNNEKLKNEITPTSINHGEHQIIHSLVNTVKSTPTKNVVYKCDENTSTNDENSQAHKDDSSPHITIQIFNCLSIKVSRSSFNSIHKPTYTRTYILCIPMLKDSCIGYNS